MNELHAFDVPEDQQSLYVFTTRETPVSNVFLVKLVTSCVIVYYGHRSSLR
jgi:hypothetical protein